MKNGGTLIRKFRITALAAALICALGSVDRAWGQASWSSGSGGAIYYNGGNVGIGTSAPATTDRLDVVGKVRIQDPNATFWGWELSTDTSANFDLSYWGGYFAQHVIYANYESGNVGIGTTNPQNTLSVNGTIQAKEVLVNTGWSDYVFDPSYRLAPLTEVAAYIKTHQHLPDVPSAADVEKNGVPLGEVESKLLAKIEELTLHMIAADERNNKLERENQGMRERLAQIETQIASQKNGPGK